MVVRSERDSFGEITVPASRLWGAQTQRSLINFDIGAERMPVEVIHALALIKKAAARQNHARGALPSPLCEAIVAAADDVLSGRLDDEFPLVVWQTGSGTQSNMNVNEVIANVANERLGGRRGDKAPVHPNDHVNLAQSSNDTFPTAMNIAAVTAVQDGVLPQLRALHTSLLAKSTEWASIVKTGRTHLMDATPLTLGQEASGWAAQVAASVAHIEATLAPVFALAIGGTAVGTGLLAPKGWDVSMADEIARLSGRAFVAAPNKFAALAAHDDLVALSGAFNTAACALSKIANDVRLLGSGPRCGLAELQLPENEPGSSIMPGKVNPTQAESLTMVAARVVGNHAAITFAGAQGHLQLQAWKPVIIYSLLQSARLIADGARAFRLRCVDGMTANEARIAALLGQSLMLVTALTPAIGYDAAARIAKFAHDRSITLREAALTFGGLTPERFDALVRPENMVAPE